MAQRDAAGGGPARRRVASLRRRYLVVAGLLIVAVAVCIGATQYYLSRVGEAGFRHIAQRAAVTRELLHAKNALVQARDLLDLYLLSPSARYREAFHVALNDAEAAVARLAGLEWVHEMGLADAVRALAPQLASLHQRGDQLMSVRLDAVAMYPAMRLANGRMLAANRAIASALELAIVEAREEDDGATETLLVETRNTWNRLISAYRLYLINRLGSLFEDALPGQLGDVETLYAQLDGQLRRLAAVRRAGRLGLQGEESVETLLRLAPQWYRDYQVVVGINSGETWRGDVPLIRDIIQPGFRHLREHLGRLDRRLSEHAQADVVAQQQAVQLSGYVLWLLAAFIALVVAGGYRTFSRRLLAPVAQVVRQLHAEAGGRGGGALPPADTAEVQALVSAFAQMRDQVHRRQRALEYQALHDDLTGLPNRTLLQDRLQRAMLAAHRDGTGLALVLLDLNRFKEINDTLGHQAGDRLLQQVAARLAGTLRESDTVARLGGDEFAMVLPEIRREGVEAVARKMLEALEEVYAVEDHRLYIGASLGIALYPEHGTTTEELMRHADVAMYLAKRSNSGVAVYEAERDRHSVGQLALLSSLRRALESGQMELHYQPKVAAGGGTLMGFEALLRWHHPDRGLVPPDEFIPLAEQTGLIRKLSRWVVDRALEQSRRWQRAGTPVPVAVNLSVWDLQDADFPAWVEERLRHWDVGAGHLELEITESAMMLEPERAHEVVAALAGLGLRVSIDDYGAGFSSLAYLKRLRLAALKIDKSFVLDMLSNENDAIIVRSTIDLAHNLGLKVVAEGVEDGETAALLEALGCDLLQGFYIARPAAATEVEAWMAARPARATNA